MLKISRYTLRVLLVAVAFLLSACTSGPLSPNPPEVTTSHLLKTETPSGRFIWDFSAFSPESRPEAEQVALASERFYTEHFGAPWYTLKVSFQFEVKSHGGQFDVDRKSCKQGDPRATIGLLDQSSWRIQQALPHEVAHALLGCGGQGGRFSEAHAEALSQLYHRKVGSKENIGLDLPAYQQANRPGIGVTANRYGEFQKFTPLNHFRYEMLGASLRQYEEAHPGFLRRQYMAMYQATRQIEATRDASFLGDFDGLAIGRTLDPAFGPWLATQHIFDDPPNRDVVMSVVLHNRVQVFAFGYDQFGQKPRPGLELSVSVQETGQSLSVRATDEKGLSANLDIGWMKQEYGLTQVTIVVEGGGMIDRHTYPIL